MTTAWGAFFLALAIPAGAAQGVQVAQVAPFAQFAPRVSTTVADTPVFLTANRKGSRRVGGSGRSGKGGRYVGGRRR